MSAKFVFSMMGSLIVIEYGYHIKSLYRITSFFNWSQALLLNIFVQILENLFSGMWQYLVLKDRQT